MKHDLKNYITLAILSCVLIMANSLTAQRDQAFSIGINGAATIYGIANQNNYGQKEMDYRVPLGIAAGMSLQYQADQRHILLGGFDLRRQGQKYQDNFNNKAFEKTVEMTYFAMPLLYRRLLGTKSGYQGVSTFGKPRWFVEGGLQPAILTAADIEWRINNQVTDFLTFISDGGNPNAAEIAEIGVPTEDVDFFQTFDLVFMAGTGFYSGLSENIDLVIEARGGIGLTDINAVEWRLENREGVYGASRTTFFELRIGLHFQISE